MCHLDDLLKKNWGIPCPDGSIGGPGTLLSGTNKKPKIETDFNELSWSTCNPQQDSPLFSILPAELRLCVFEYATAPYDDKNSKYAEEDYYYRPGYHARHLTDTTLLLTCRRVWLEANHLPMRQADMTFWFGGRHGPPWTSSMPRFATRKARCERLLRQGEVQQAADYNNEDKRDVRLFRILESMTSSNLKNCRSIRIFVTQRWLGVADTTAAQWAPGELMDTLVANRRSCLGYLLRLNGMIGKMRWPPTVIFTHPFVGWYMWYDGNGPRMRTYGWIRDLLTDSNFQNVRIFKLQLECLENHVLDMIDIIGTLKRDHCKVDGWQIDSESGREIMSWTGLRKVISYSSLTSEMMPTPEQRQVTYKVFEVVWHNKPNNTDAGL